MEIRFCFSEDWNDHNAYPRGLAAAPPAGWSYRSADVELDPELGRPWSRFKTLPGEWIHASSLLPRESTPWVFDNDHSEYLFQQMGYGRHPAMTRDAAERLIVRSLSSPSCMGLIAWSESSRRSIEELFHRQNEAVVDVCVAYPGVVPPSGSPSRAEAEMLNELRAHLGAGTTRMLAVDSQTGICEIEGRKNLSDAVLSFLALRQLGADVELIVVSAENDSYSHSERHHRLPRLSRQALWEVYGMAEILLFLTRADATGFVLLEAMFYGLCCIAADAPSSPAVAETIEEGVTGFKVQYFRPAAYPSFSHDLDVRSVVEAVRRLISDRALRTAIGRAAMSSCSAGGRFSVEVRNATIQRHVERNHQRLRETASRK
jgi:hypothetical protein